MKTLTQVDLDRVAGKSSREAAEILGVGKTTVNKFREIARINGGVLPGSAPVAKSTADANAPKVLFLDIETKPAIVATFNLWKPILGPQNILEDPDILCFTYNWEGEEVQFVGQDEYTYHEVLRVLYELFDEADYIVTYNGQSFDIKWIEGELNLAGFNPPSPYQQIDLYRKLRQRSKFINNKLEYVVSRFLDDHKVTHAGMALWLGCMAGDEAAWAKMREYAVKDTQLLEPLYQRVRAWLPQHPNRSLFGDEALACTRCQSVNYQKRGLGYSRGGKYQKYQCRDCGGYFSDGNRIAPASRARSI